MDVTIRPFRESDYARWVEIGNAVYPDHPTTEEAVRYADSTWDSARYDRLRLVAEDATGRVLGAALISHMPVQFDPRKYAVAIRVDPAWQRRGIGSALYDRLLTELRARHAISARTSAQATMTASLAFLERRGFVEMLRGWESILDVETFDFAPFAGAEARVADQGITVTTLAAERQRDPAAVRRAYELYTACWRDVPAIDPITDLPFEEFVNHQVDAPSALLDAFFIARDGDRYVGVSNLHRSLAEPDTLLQDLTGVLPGHRGRGIALALKLCGIRYARNAGMGHIKTGNDTRNRPMLRINEALGFQKQPVWIEFEKRPDA